MIRIKDPLINNCNSPNTLSCNIEEINKIQVLGTNKFGKKGREVNWRLEEYRLYNG